MNKKLTKTPHMKSKLLTLCIALLTTFITNAQARLTIENNSTRYMTVKVMRGAGTGSLHETVYIPAYRSETVYFSSSGTYFTKSKAVLAKKEPVYKKGRSFRVTNDETGYSVLTLTFTIRESAVVESSGQSISKTEFDQN
jgi:hypothetical protein